MVHKIGIILFNSKIYARGGRQRDLSYQGVELSLGGSLQKGLPCVTLGVKKGLHFKKVYKTKLQEKQLNQTDHTSFLVTYMIILSSMPKLYKASRKADL